MTAFLHVFAVNHKIKYVYSAFSEKKFCVMIYKSIGNTIKRDAENFNVQQLLSRKNLLFFVVLGFVYNFKLSCFLVPGAHYIL